MVSWLIRKTPPAKFDPQAARDLLRRIEAPEPAIHLVPQGAGVQFAPPPGPFESGRPLLRGFGVIWPGIARHLPPNAALGPPQFQGDPREPLSVFQSNHDDVPFAYDKLSVFQGSSSS